MAYALIASMLAVAPATTPDLAEAVGRAQALAADEAWSEAARVLDPVVDAETASAPVLALYTRVVLEAGDLRRARLLSERGLLRFPEELIFRRLDLAVLIGRRDWREARAAARAVLARDPDDDLAWRQLAAATVELEAEPAEASRAALEAAWLARPEDPQLFDRHLRAQLAADHVDEAVRLAEEGLGRRELAVEDPERVELAVRAAEAGQRPELADRWLALIPPERRPVRLVLLEARLALARDRPRQAEAALARLIDRGEASPAVLVRAGQLAEERGELGRAEALYRRAAEGSGDDAHVATLTLARFLTKVRNYERAEVVLRTYLTERPDDPYARQLLRLTETARDAAASR